MTIFQIVPDWSTQIHIFDNALMSVFAVNWLGAHCQSCDSPQDVASVDRRTTSCSRTACSDVWSAPTCDLETSNETFLTKRSPDIITACLTRNLKVLTTNAHSTSTGLCSKRLRYRYYSQSTLCFKKVAIFILWLHRQMRCWPIVIIFGIIVAEEICNKCWLCMFTHHTCLMCWYRTL